MRLNLRVWMLCQNLPLQRFACISGGGGGTKVGVERRKNYNLCPVLSDSEPFLWYIIAPESSILVFFMILMSLIESDYDLYDFDDS